MEDIEEFLSSAVVDCYKKGNIFQSTYTSDHEGFSHGRWVGLIGKLGIKRDCGGYGSPIGDRRATSTGCVAGKNSGSSYGIGQCTNGGGIKSINGMAVHRIDDIDTIIISVDGDVARGYILREDLRMQPCYVAKSTFRKPRTSRPCTVFAHGSTREDAIDQLNEKISSLHIKKTKK